MNIEKIIEEIIEKNDYEKLDSFFKEYSSDPSNENTLNLLLKKSLMNEEMCLFLLDKDLDIHFGQEYLFRHACKIGSLNIVKKLIEKKANLFNLGCHSFIFALENHHFKITDLLLTLDQNNEIKKIPNLYLKSIGESHNNMDAFHYLYNKGFELDDMDAVLREATRRNQREEIDFLLNLGAKVTNGSPNSLEIAIKNKNIELINYYLSLNPNLDNNKNNYLTLACRYELIDVVKYLLKNNIVIENEKSIIKTVVLAENILIMNLLKEYGINFNHFNELGLRRAIENEKYNAITFLVENGADINFMDGQFLDKAIIKQDEKMIEILIINNIKLNGKILNSPNTPIKEFILKCHNNHMMKTKLEKELNNKPATKKSKI